jgi:hypothetical protein
MKFEAKILELSTIKERNLVGPSSIAMVKPDTGVEIRKKSAYYVIRDCATLAHDYIAHKCYASLDSPIQSLYGAFSKGDIIDFVARTKSEDHTRQLLWIIFSDIYKLEADDWSPPPEPIPSETLEIDADAQGADIYQDYGYGDDEEWDDANTISMPVSPPTDLGDGEAIIAKLVAVFGASKEKKTSSTADPVS